MVVIVIGGGIGVLMVILLIVAVFIGAIGDEWELEEKGETLGPKEMHKTVYLKKVDKWMWMNPISRQCCNR